MIRNKRRVRFGARFDALEERALLSLLTVTSARDDVPGSLRAVIGQATAGDVIRFAPKLKGATLRLSQGTIDVTQSISIVGSGQTIDAQHLSSIFNAISQGGNPLKLTLSNLKMIRGTADLHVGDGDEGGAIRAIDCSLKLSNCVFQSNTAQSSGESTDHTNVYMAAGGAIYAEQSSLALTNCRFLGNSVAGGQNTSDEQAGQAIGGAIMAGSSTLTITGGTFRGNTAHGGDAVNPMTYWPSSYGGWAGGGAISLANSGITVRGTVFQSNQAIGGKGLDGALSGYISQGKPAGLAGSGGNAGGGAIALQGTTWDLPSNPIVISGARFLDNTSQGGVAGTAQNSTQSNKLGGGQAAGGAVLSWHNTTLSLSQSVFNGNAAIGGNAGPNPTGLGKLADFGGDAQGGAVHTEGSEGVTVNSCKFLADFAQGGKGGDAPSDGSTVAGAGGWAYGGGLSILNNYGQGMLAAVSPAIAFQSQLPKEQPMFPIDPGQLGGGSPFVVPVSINTTTFQNNAVRGGSPGAGVLYEARSGGGAQGGGLVITEMANLKMTNTNFLGNSSIGGKGTMALAGGFAIALGSDQYSQALIQGGLFRNNTVVGGSDPYAGYRDAQGGAFMSDTAGTVLIGVAFQGNSAIGGADTGSGSAGSGCGGAVFTTGQFPTLTLVNCSFTRNKALGGTFAGAAQSDTLDNGAAYGGAVDMTNGTLTVTGGTFSNNVAQGSNSGQDRNAEGGAICAQAVNNSEEYGYSTNTSLMGVTFRNNQAVARGESTAMGGAVASYGTILQDQGSTFTTNLAKAYGGTAYGGGVTCGLDPEQNPPVVPVAKLRGTRLTGNQALGVTIPAGPTAQGFGGGIAFVNNPQAVLAWIAYQRNKATTAGPNQWGNFTPPSI